MGYGSLVTYNLLLYDVVKTQWAVVAVFKVGCMLYSLGPIKLKFMSLTLLSLFPQDATLTATAATI